MKKTILLFISVVSLLGFLYIATITFNNQQKSNKIECFQNHSKSNSYKDISIDSSEQNYSYSQLMNEANVVAVVKVTDTLSRNNSTLLLTDNNSISGFFAKRHAIVESLKKDDIGIDKSDLSFIEPAAITNNDEYIHAEDYDTMIEGQEYLVFLNTKNESRQLSIISGDLGQVNLNSKSDTEKVVAQQAINSLGVE